MGVAEVDEVLFELVLVAGRIAIDISIDFRVQRKILRDTSTSWNERTYGSGYRFSPSRSIWISGDDGDSFVVLLESCPLLSSFSPGPYAFSFASRRIFLPSSL